MWMVNLLLQLLLSIIQPNIVSSQSCSSPDQFDNVQKDTAISGSTFLKLTDLGLISCSKECLLRSACQSFNYEPGTQECQLNKNSSSSTDAGNIVSSVGTLSSDRSTWPSLFAGACSSTSCPDNSVCVENDGNAACEIECHDPELQNGAFTGPITHTVGSTLSFECDAGLTATGQAQCQADGTWTSFSCDQMCVSPPSILRGTRLTFGSQWTPGSVIDYSCSYLYVPLGKVMCKSDGTWTDMQCVKKVTTCYQLSQCTNRYSDGEYWIYPTVFGDKPVKIYCHNMLIGTPREYLTLPEENYVDYSDIACDPNDGIRTLFTGCETVRFNKLRITDISNMVTVSAGLKDYQFINTSTTCYYTQFGNVNDCHASTECSTAKTRDYVINTQGTGVKVSSLQQWSAPVTSTTLLDPFTIIKKDAGRKITVKCHQPCRWCYPNADTYTFEYDDDFIIDISSATVPNCLTGEIDD